MSFETAQLPHPAPVEPGDGLVHLRAGGVSLVVDTRGPRLPRVMHWGHDLGALSATELGELSRASERPAVHNILDEPEPVGLVPEPSGGWFGTPGIAGHRDGVAFSTRFVVIDTQASLTDAGGAIRVDSEDPEAHLGLRLDIELTEEGLVRVRAHVQNLGPGTYTLDSLLLALPIPSSASEVLDFTGRHTRERSPQRRPLGAGSAVRAGRKGRTGTDSTLLMMAGTPSFGFESGSVWGVHTAWSGNHLTLAERESGGATILAGGELILPGEVRLSRGESYTSPWLFGSYGDGIDELSHRFHGFLRRRPQHPRTPRPVTLNTWEAVYFEHDLEKLGRLADRAAEIGVERFVLDDGWFLGRRNDTTALGDWEVDRAVWPEGLHPLVDRVRAHGMQFGLWFEPEMISVRSRLAEQHPEWILSVGDRLPLESRHQQVLDLGNPDAYAYILQAISALVTEYSIDYIKWDHNRDLVEPGHPLTGRAAVHDQTLATYAMIDELKSRHPGLEIESCSSGGARVDLGILDRTDRVWASDSLDALERQQIQRWTGLVVPPEMMGAHIGAARSHTTGRTHTLGFRAASAVFQHFGLELDLDVLDDPGRAEVARWVNFHRRHRDLLHTGRTVHADHPDPSLWVTGVVKDDQREALYSVVAVASGVWTPPGRIRLPGLNPETTYRLELVSGLSSSNSSLPPWAADGIALSGRVLAHIGIEAPALMPETAELIHAVATPSHPHTD